MTNQNANGENKGLKWVENGLRRKDRIVDAVALIEASRYLDEYSKQSPEDLVGTGNNFQKDLRHVGVATAANILRPFATELALKAVYEWENDHEKTMSGHDLTVLYGALSQQSQELLKDQYLSNSQRLKHTFPTPATIQIEELLEEFKNAFEQERYFTEEKYFTPGYSSPNLHRLDLVVLAAWEILTKDTKMTERIFNLDAIIRVPEQQMAPNPHIVRRRPIYDLTKPITPSTTEQEKGPFGQETD